MKEVGSPKLLFENHDLTPIHPTLTGLHKTGPGRPVYVNSIPKNLIGRPKNVSNIAITLAKD